MIVRKGNLESNYTLFDKVWRIDELLLLCSNFNKFREEKIKFIDFTQKSFIILQLLSYDLKLSKKTSQDLEKLYMTLSTKKACKEYEILKLIIKYTESNDGLLLRYQKIIELMLDKNKDFLKFVDSSKYDKSEGNLVLAIHLYKERNKKLVNLKKQDYYKKNGNLECEVCKFDFFKTYGKRGLYFAEVHHDLPISSYSGKQQTLLSDLSIVCSNCHKMIHRKYPWPTVKYLKKELNSIKKDFAA